MASSKSEIELSPLPTKDEADGKPDEVDGKPEEEPVLIRQRNPVRSF